MKPYEGCATCKWYKTNKRDCEHYCEYEVTSKRDLIIRMIDDDYTNAEHDLIKKALLKEYDFDYAKRFETNNEGDDVSMHLNDMINMDNGKRISKVEYYLGIADAVLKRGTCLRRNYGSVIVKDDHIVSTGYNGAPRGRVNCCDLGKCYRQEHNIPQGERYECCRSVHSEMNAIINASPEEMKGATLYLVGHENDGSLTDANCCMMCKRVIINSGISHVVLRQSNGSFKTVDVSEWIEHDDSLNM